MEYNIENVKKELKEHDMMYIKELKDLVKSRLSIEENNEVESLEKDIKLKIELARNIIELFDKISN